MHVQVWDWCRCTCLQMMEGGCGSSRWSGRENKAAAVLTRQERDWKVGVDKIREVGCRHVCIANCERINLRNPA